MGIERKEGSRTKRNDGMGIERNEVKIESERDDEILLMLQDNEQLEPDEKLMNILDKEKLNNIQHELEQDEELIHEYEKNQMEHNILYELNDATERIIANFENMNMEETEDEIDYHRNLNHEDDENTDINENTDTDDGETDLDNLNQEIAALFTKQRETITRLRARIERLNGKTGPHPDYRQY